MPRPRASATPAVAGMAAAAFLLVACGASAGDPGADHARVARPPTVALGAARPGQRPPAVCGPLRVRRIGAVSAPGLTELSGLVRSPAQAGVLWAHNDSGDAPRLFALRVDGSLVAEVAVSPAEAVDWEDVAAAAGALWLADVGDNDERREAVAVYRVAEPAPPFPGASAPATRLTLRYPDGPHDAETLLVEPRTGELALVTKELGGDGRAYLASPAAVARAAAGETVTLRRGPRIGLGGATAGDVSADGRTVVVRGYAGLVAWRKGAAESLARTLRRRPCTGRVSLSAEGQGEALALARDGRSFVTAPEGAGAVLRRYAPR